MSIGYCQMPRLRNYSEEQDSETKLQFGKQLEALNTTRKITLKQPGISGFL